MQVEQTVSDTLDTKQLLSVLIAVKKGDFTVRMPPEHTGMAGKIADALNEIIELNQRIAFEFDRVSVAVGKEGKTTQRAVVGTTTGTWCIEAGASDYITKPVDVEQLLSLLRVWLYR